MSELKRLNKFISDSGMCSRREADKLIEDKKVLVNGEIASIGTKVGLRDIVKVNQRVIKNKKRRVYMAFNKPVGITSTTDLKDLDNIIDFINYGERIFPIGRLDKMSEGLLFLTNDGDIVNKILRAGNNHEKEYIVTVDKSITSEFITKMSSGVHILDTVTNPCKVEKMSKYIFKIILTQGLNRQIRRMSKVLGYNVTKLKRTRIMNIELRGIEDGQWRYLTESEINKINNMVADSSKTEEVSVTNKNKPKSTYKKNTYRKNTYNKTFSKKPEDKKEDVVKKRSKKKRVTKNKKVRRRE